VLGKTLVTPSASQTCEGTNKKALRKVVTKAQAQDFMTCVLHINKHSFDEHVPTKKEKRKINIYIYIMVWLLR
jgi:hypothetical protein